MIRYATAGWSMAACLACAAAPAFAQSPAPQGMMTTPLGIPMTRMGSGTTWIPDATPIPTGMARLGGLELTFHGVAFAQYDGQGGPRGDTQFGSLNWGMLMASHTLAGGMLQARTMLSLDAATVTGRGYPLLLQTGESYRGAPLHDRQHPHDFLMELSALYLRGLGPRVGLELYAAASGEPAIGPVAFMHRPSAVDDPAAPIGHHWQDATHISFGVFTAGLFGRRWKAEASWFNGREPDEHRWDFDFRRLDSYSGRLTVNPSAHWSATLGYGFLKSPESARPDDPMRRVVASLLYGSRLGAGGHVSATAIFGANRQAGIGSASALLEAELAPDRRNTVTIRAELVQKSADELVLDPDAGFPAERRFTVGGISGGYIREVVQARGMSFGLGARGTVDFVPAALRDVYGSRTPLGLVIFGRLRLRERDAGMGSMEM